MNAAVDQKIDSMEINGALTPEQAASLLNEVTREGDTVPASTENAGKPEASAAPEKAEKSDEAPKAEEPKPNEQAAQTQEPDPSNAVILAKDGKHTIPFDKLVEARTEAQNARAQAEQARQQAEEMRRRIAELETIQAQAAKAAEQAAPPAVAVNVQQLRKEAMEALIDGDTDKAAELNAKVDAEILRAAQLAAAKDAQEKLEATRAALERQFADFQKAQQAQVGFESATAKLYEAHPDADAIWESKELRDWINSQKVGLVKQAYDAVLQAPSPETVSELLAAYKEATGSKTTAPAAPTPDPKAAQAAAKAAIANARTTPATLSDIPGGKAPITDPAAALEAKSGPDMLSSILANGWSQEQIDNWINRSL